MLCQELVWKRDQSLTKGRWSLWIQESQGLDHSSDMILPAALQAHNKAGTPQTAHLLLALFREVSAPHAACSTNHQPRPEVGQLGGHSLLLPGPSQRVLL